MLIQALQELLESTKQNKILELQRFGREFGFFDFSMRSKAYMVLLNITEEDMELNQTALTVDLVPQNDEIILNDARRSFREYKEMANLSQKDIEVKQADLSQILHHLFKRHKSYSYYQGLHNFAELFLMVFGKSLASLMLERYCQKYLYLYLTNQGFEDEIKNQIYITLKILDKELPNYKDIIGIDEDCSNGAEKLGFIVCWIVTWFSYRTKNLERIFRTFDYLMCTPRHTVSILVSLVIRQLIQRHKLLPGAEEEDVFTAFYSGDLDELNWEGMYKEATLLNELEDYGQLDYRKNKDSRLGKLVNGLKGRIQGGISMLKLSRDDNSNSKSFKDKLKAGISKGIALGSGLFKRKESKSRSRSRDQQ